MKRLLLFLLLITPVAIASATDISNGDFESKRKLDPSEVSSFASQQWKVPADNMIFFDWKPNLSQPGEYECISETALCHDGEGCLYLKGTFLSNTPFPTSQRPAEVTVTLWVRSRDDSKKDFTVSLYFYQSSYAFLKELTVQDECNKDWTKITKTFEVPSSVDSVAGPKKVDLFVVAVGTHMGCLFDDVTVEMKGH